MQKCYGLTLAGKVQDAGFRILIEDIARLHDLKGYAFNDADGTVKMVCCGENGVISDFFEDVRIKGDRKGIIFDITDKKELPLEIPLPIKFIRLYTDELADISRKLDVGIGILKDIKSDTSVLPEIKNILGSFVIEQREHNTHMDEHNQWMKDHLTKMDEHNQWMKEHNQHLEKILEKLAAGK